MSDLGLTEEYRVDAEVARDTIRAQAAALDRVRAECPASNHPMTPVPSARIHAALAAAPEATARDTYERGIRDASGRIIEPQITAEQACERLTRDLSAANARVAELERVIGQRNEEVSAAGDRLSAANARADAAERDLEQAHIDTKATVERWQRAESEAAVLRAEVERVSEGRRAVLMQKTNELAIEWRRAERAESEAAVLRAEVEDLKAELEAAGRVQEQRRTEVGRLRTEREQERRDEKAWRDERRAELAAANALLERCKQWAVDNKAWVLRDKIDAHLSGQAPARTDLDRAVLEAMGNVPEFALRRVNPPSDWASPARAELARREFNAANQAGKGNE